MQSIDRHFIIFIANALQELLMHLQGNCHPEDSASTANDLVGILLFDAL